MTDARTLFAKTLVLAPMTKGSNLPYRRLCRELGADVTVGEMALAKHLAQKRRGELALLRTHPTDHPFGAQLADRHDATLEVGAKMAVERGADFVDLNCGCPIDEFTRKGLGAALLQHPAKFARLVGTLRKSVEVPITVKLRLGWNDDTKNFLELARLAVDAGADAITLHGRTREQRYSKAADWDAIAALKASVNVPVIGNGDLLTWWEIDERWTKSGVDAVMISRGALIKPWIFQEAKEKRTIHKTAAERMALLRRYVELAREHFGTDDHATVRIRMFLVWHLAFFCRYRHLPDATYRQDAWSHPLLQTRLPDPPPITDGLEGLLARVDKAAHEHVAAIALGEIGEDAPHPPLPENTREAAVEAEAKG